jgi:hypothetical protein
MRKYKSKYLKPYIRRIKSGDCKKALDSDIRTYHAVCMAIDSGRGGYVLVQHGASHILAYAPSKWELKNKVAQVRFSRKGKNQAFKSWTNDVKHYAQHH